MHRATFMGLSPAAKGCYAWREGTDWSRRVAFRHRKAQRPFLSAGKGGLQSGQMLTSRNATKPVRRARNGHPALGDSSNAPGFKAAL